MRRARQGRRSARRPCVPTGGGGSPPLTRSRLGAVVIYLTWASLINENYWWKPYISPLYSPCLANKCPAGSGFAWIPWVTWLTPAILIIWGPMGFRFTCYYYRKAYYRAFWRAPASCAVREPHAKYTGETRFPLILQNVHRYFFYVALIFNLILTLGRGAGLPQPHRAVGAHGPRYAGADRERRPAVAVLAVVPRLPARDRRPAEALLQAPGPLLECGPRSPSSTASTCSWPGCRCSGCCSPTCTSGWWLAACSQIHGSSEALRQEVVDMTDIERIPYDVVVIGAGGSGLRAAIEARLAGKRTAIISKSLFGKAHTVMAEGGCAAAMGNVNPRDNWMVHFRDTMRGGKFLNNPRMAELHAKEAPERVWELEAWGAVFDRTKDGKISQRNFGGHEYPRLAHVGDRTGLEMIRTLQQKVVALQQEDALAHRRPRSDDQGLRRDDDHAADQGRRGPDRRRVRLHPGDRPVRRVRGARGHPGDRRHRQDLQGQLQLLGVHRRRARARAAGRGQAAQHGVRPVPPDPHGVAASRCAACW